MVRRNRVILAGLLAAVLVGVSGCWNSSDDKTTVADHKGFDRVTYVTAFGNAGRDAFAYVAQAKGYFADDGIDVNIQLGKGAGDNAKQVATGAAQFSSLDLMGAWILENSTPAYRGKFRTIAAIHQQSLVAIISLEGSKITTPQDLAGKRIGAAANSVNQLLFPAYARIAGLDPSSVQWVGAAPADVPKLLATGRVDAVSTFLIGQAGIEKLAGRKAVILPYSTYLSDLFGNGIIASNQVLDKDPDLARRMRDALMKGLQYTIDHPDEAAEILHKAQPSADIAAAKGEITSMTPYVPAPAGAPLGSMSPSRVAKSLAILQGAGLMQHADPDSVVDFDLIPGN